MNTEITTLCELNSNTMTWTLSKQYILLCLKRHVWHPTSIRWTHGAYKIHVYVLLVSLYKIHVYVLLVSLYKRHLYVLLVSLSKRHLYVLLVSLNKRHLYVLLVSLNNRRVYILLLSLNWRCNTFKSWIMYYTVCVMRDDSWLLTI
jgi:hypothetical protein